MEMTLTLGDAARHYFELGWHPLELPAGQKDPPPVGRTGKEGRDMTREEVVAAAWTGNIGLRMPIDVIGLDIDAYRGGMDTLKALVAELGPLPPTCISHNGRNDGSGIRFFRVAPGFTWVTTLAGIDIIQRGHRYAAVCPSIHPDGRCYAVWDQAEGEPGELWAVEDLPELPWPWFNRLSRLLENDTVSHAVTATEVQSFIGICTEGEAPGYLTVIVELFNERRRAGFSRHDTMVHCLIWAMECARAGIVSAGHAVKTLGGLWVDAVLPDDRRAELYHEGRVTEFDAMLRHAVGKAEAKTPEEMGELRDGILGLRINGEQPGEQPGKQSSSDEDPPPEDEPPPSPRRGLNIRPLPDPFVIPTVEWHAEGLLSFPTHGELAGAEKSLKSYVGLCIDVGLAAGLPILGRFPVPAPQRVVLLVGEGGEGPWLRRLAAVCAAYGIEPGDVAPNVRFTTTALSVTSLGFVDDLEDCLDVFEPALVHLDPWYAYASGMADSRQVTEVGAMLARLGDVCSGYGSSLLINHHFNRIGNAGLRQITGAGHAEWVDSWLLTRHREVPDVGAGQYRLRLDVGSRQWGGNAYDLDLDIDPITQGLTWGVEVASDVSAEDDADNSVGAIADAMVEVLREGRKARKPLTRAEWLDRVHRRKAVKAPAFDALVADGQIVVANEVTIGRMTTVSYVVADRLEGSR